MTTIIVIFLQSCLKFFKYSIITIEDVRDKEEPEPFAKKENWNEQKENCKKQKEKLERREEKSRNSILLAGPVTSDAEKLRICFITVVMPKTLLYHSSSTVTPDVQHFVPPEMNICFAPEITHFPLVRDQQHIFVCWPGLIPFKIFYLGSNYQTPDYWTNHDLNTDFFAWYSGLALALF